MSTRVISKGNLHIVIYGCYRVCGYSYNTLILDLMYNNNGRDLQPCYFNSTYYSSTTTRHQGYLADIFVRVTTAKDPHTEIEKISADNLHYMSVSERKHWDLV